MKSQFKIRTVLITRFNSKSIIFFLLSLRLSVGGFMGVKKKLAFIALASPFNPEQMANYLAKLTPRVKLGVARMLSKKKFGLSLLEMEEEDRKELLEKLSDREMAQIINSQKSDDATDLIHSLESSRVKNILKNLTKKKLEEIRPLLNFEEETAGGLMQSEFVSVRSSDTVSEAIEKIRQCKEAEEIHNVFALNSKKQLVGVVPLRKLVISKPTEKISRIMNRSVISVKSTLDQEQVAKKFKEYDLVSMPVVDSKNKLLGIITVDDAIDVLEEEATEDMLRFAGVDEEESIFSSPIASVKRRTPWLIFDLLIVMISASVIGLFENTIAAVIVLAVFMPVVANLGGNAGTQTLAVMVRSLALGEISVKEYKKALGKEVTVGIINGIVIGSFLFVLAIFWKNNFAVGIILFLAMITNQLTAALAGTLVPIIFKWRKIDPALASSVIITGCTDIMGFLAFLGIATVFLHFGLLS